MVYWVKLNNHKRDGFLSMKHTLSSPLSVSQLSPMTGVYSGSTHINDRQGFIDRVMEKWASQRNAHSSLQSIQHYQTAERLYDFYLEFRKAIDKIDTNDHPKHALLNVSVHELMRGGTVEDATNLLRNHVHFINRSDKLLDNDPLCKDAHSTASPSMHCCS